MRVIHQDVRAGRITDFESVEAFATRLAATRDEAHVTLLTIAAGGRIGSHPAAMRQVFAVVSGRGWVAGDDGGRLLVEAGDVVVWEAGEQHESGSDDGMTVVAVESRRLEGPTRA